MDLYTILKTNSDFSILFSIITPQEMLILKSKKNYTIFAPTNSVFAEFKNKYPIFYSKLTDKNPQHKELRENFIKSHITNFTYLNQDILNIDYPLKSLNSKSQPLNIIKNINEIILNNIDGDKSNYNAKILGSDIIATNGVIHAIDNILIPSNVSPTELNKVGGELHEYDPKIIDSNIFTTKATIPSFIVTDATIPPNY